MYFSAVYGFTLILLGIPLLWVCNQNTVGKMATFNPYARKYLANGK